jgi:haloacetate dehalogenase
MIDFMHGMHRQSVRANGIRLNTWTGGGGPALVLLHGYPQTAQMWRKMTPALVKQFNVICPDLRGYGDSDKPRDGFDKRTMARDIAELMRELGHDRYMVVGHDRGARVAHRLALDHAGAVSRLVFLDIVPTHTVFRDTGKELAAAYWHWFFFQAPDLPEIMIRNSAEPFLRTMFVSSYDVSGVELAAGRD